MAKAHRPFLTEISMERQNDFPLRTAQTTALRWLHSLTVSTCAIVSVTDSNSTRLKASTVLDIVHLFTYEIVSEAFFYIYI